jgi:hypothetical protein
MTIQSTSEIGAVLRNAAAFNFRNPPEVLMNSDSLVSQVEQLFNLLASHKVDYVLVGGIAMLTYVEGRNTQDIDLIMSLPSLARLPEIVVESQEMYFARGKYGELQIDIRLTKNPLFAKVGKKYSTLKIFGDRKIRCATIEGLILLKLFALPSLYRQGSFERVAMYENDIATLMHAYSPDLDPLLKELKKHLNETDMLEARRILADLETRIQKFLKDKKRP